MKSLEKFLKMIQNRAITPALNELARFKENIKILAQTGAHDFAKWRPVFTVEKWACDADREAGLPPLEVVRVEGNLLLNEGITEMLALLIGTGGTAFSNANARIGVGDSSTAAVATQTDLQGTNKVYKAMDATYPQVSGQTVTFRATFTGEEANFAWREITADNGPTAAKNLNRKVQNMGTKVSPASWTASLSITIG